jgi:hypothetical protein
LCRCRQTAASAEGVDADLAVVASVVHNLPDAVLENDYSKGERNAVLG